MRKLILGIAAFALTAAVLTACGSSKEASSDPAAAEEKETSEEKASDAEAGDAAGDITIANHDFTLDLNTGETFTLSEQTDKVVFVNLWASWCGPCVRELPALCKLYDHYADAEDVVIVAVNCGDSVKSVDKFVEEKGYTIPIAYDHGNKALKVFKNESIPMTMIFGKDGTIQKTVVGAPMDTSGLCDEYIEIIEGLR